MASDPYSEAGVDYNMLDLLKRSAGREARKTSQLLSARGGHAVDASRGESAFVFEISGQTLGFVQECLGTKSVIAQDYERATGEALFDVIAFDTVAAIVNDLVCVGALPLVVNAYFATGASEWYTPERTSALVQGWSRACAEAGAVWGGGESPSLPGLVDPERIELAGAAVGRVPGGREPVLGQALAEGDEIVLVASSGLHANGASLARRVAGGIEDGLLHRLPSGRTLGEALLTRSFLYVRLVESLLEAGLPLTYMVHVTGHGLRKLMRSELELTYRVTDLLPVPEVLQFLAAELSLSTREAYGLFNMGCGFAVFTAPGGGDDVAALATDCGLVAARAGRVESGTRRLILEPVDVVFDGGELALR